MGIWVGVLWEEPDKSDCKVPYRSSSASLQCKATEAKTLARYGVEVQNEQKMMRRRKHKTTAYFPLH